MEKPDGIEIFSKLKDRELKKENVLIAEGAYLVESLFHTDCRIISVLCNTNLAEYYQTLTKGKCPCYVLSNERLKEITGFPFHRGVMAACERPPLLKINRLLDNEYKTIVVCTDLVDAENIGSIYRSAAAFGIDALCVGSQCHGPYSRRTMRVSMGAVLKIPTFQINESDISSFKEKGFLIIGTTLASESINLSQFKPVNRFVLLLGNEATGLSPKWCNECDQFLKIPISSDIDSLNVAIAASIFFYQLTQKK